MTERILISRLSDLDHVARSQAVAPIDAIFFEASNTKSFVSEAVRCSFRERWLGRYLDHDARNTYLAFDVDSGKLCGYVAGSLDDPALTARFADIGYFERFGALTRIFPAHLHINVAADHRGRGIGALLIEHFCGEAAIHGAPGVHVVTSPAARNTRFYARHGFQERGRDGEGAKEVVLLGRVLR